MAVVEPQPQVHAQGYAPADAFDDADDVHCLTADRHEVDESYGSLIGIEFGFQHHGVAAVSAARRADWAGRSDQPPTVFFGAKQSSEDSPESNRGTHSQSIDPLRLTNAAVSVSPITA